jgi:hypothetical protein
MQLTSTACRHGSHPAHRPHPLGQHGANRLELQRVLRLHKIWWVHLAATPDEIGARWNRALCRLLQEGVCSPSPGE